MNKEMIYLIQCFPLQPIEQHTDEAMKRNSRNFKYEIDWNQFLIFVNDILLNILFSLKFPEVTEP